MEVLSAVTASSLLVDDATRSAHLDEINLKNRQTDHVPKESALVLLIRQQLDKLFAQTD